MYLKRSSELLTHLNQCKFVTVVNSIILFEKKYQNLALFYQQPITQGTRLQHTQPTCRLGERANWPKKWKSKQTGQRKIRDMDLI